MSTLTLTPAVTTLAPSLGERIALHLTTRIQQLIARRMARRAARIALYLAQDAALERRRDLAARAHTNLLP